MLNSPSGECRCILLFEGASSTESAGCHYKPEENAQAHKHWKKSQAFTCRFITSCFWTEISTSDRSRPRSCPMQGGHSSGGCPLWPSAYSDPFLLLPGHSSVSVI